MKKNEARKKGTALLKSSGDGVEKSYAAWIADLKRRYRATQIKAAVAVNTALILLCPYIANAGAGGSMAGAANTITVTKFHQSYPYSGKAMVEYTVSGLLPTNAIAEFTLNSCDTSATFIQKDIVAGENLFTIDFASSFGGAKLLTNATFEVSIREETISNYRGGVQLWENGPYWAEYNVGATKPEEYGYYFWWGDTVGYTNTASGWISVTDGTSISFTESGTAASTYNKDNSTLLSEGYIDSEGNLVAAHDSATAHFGFPWRLPTQAEFSALISNCNSTWATINGVYGRLVTGKGVYSGRSIFLPAAGIVDGTDLYNAGSGGHYWSSTLYISGDSVYSLGYLVYAWNLFFRNSYGSYYQVNYSQRYRGLSVRPVRGPIEYANAVGAVSYDKYKVVFEGNGGTGERTYYLACGSVIVAPTVSREGYLFVGWLPDVDATVPVSNVTYTAQWKIDQCVVSRDTSEYDFNTSATAEWLGSNSISHDDNKSLRSGGVGNNQSSWLEATVNGAGRVSFWWKASSEEYDGEVFDYAYLSVDGVPQGSLENYQLQGVAIGGKTDWTNIVFDVEGEGEHAIRWTYCKDEIDEVDVGDDCIWLDEFSFLPKPTISFEIGASAIGDAPSSVQDFVGADIALPKADGFFWTDHVFDGWTDGVNSFSAGSDYIIPSSNVTLVARWIAKTFVSFDIDGGGGDPPELIKALPSTIVTLPTGDGFSWVDHVFDGWTDGTKNYVGGADYAVPSTNLTLTAKWIAKSFVSFDIGDGTGNVPKTIKEVPNAIVTLPTADSLEWVDHVFSGWCDGVNVYAGGADYVVPSSNVTLAAHWLAKSFVSFDIGDGTGDVPETMKALPDETVTLPTGDRLSLTDHVFAGWADGAAIYAAGADYAVPETNVTLKAIWIAKRFLTFTLEGGDGEIPITIKDVPNAAVTLPGAEGLHKAKHTFVGWSDGTQTYDASAEYVVTDSSVEFTAVWAANSLVAPTISSADVMTGGTIETASATIEMTADSGTAIYYTLDGTEPTTNSIPYAAPFVADGMEVTIKAFAVKDDYFDSPVAEFAFSRKPYSAAECINAYGKAVSTGNNDAAWVRVLGDNTHDRVAALRSGTIGDDEASSVMLTVDGAGEVSFWWKVSSENPIRGRPKDYVSFCIDGEEQNWLGGEIDWTNEVYSIDSSGIHTLKWTYKKNDNGTVMGEDCAWLDEVTWTPWNEITTKQTVVPIPYGWLDSYGLLSGGDPEMAAKQLTGKRDGSGRFLTVEDDFIAGTDPTNESDVFSVSISMSNGFPVVEWRPNLNTNGVNRVYTIYGKATLDEEWTTPTNALSHFFKVEVAMPSQNKSDDTTGGNDNIGGDTPGDNGGSGEEPTGDDSGSTENSIPAGYSTNGVSCVTCTGSEWYDLGLPPTLTMKVQIKHSYAGEYEHTGIIGAMPQSNNDISDWRLFIANGPQYRWYLDYPGASGGLGVGSRISGGSTALNTIYEIEFGNFYVKDIPSNAVIISDASVVKECPSNNIRLFKINYAYPERIATGSVYYVKIYDMNASGEYELVRNLVPCKPDNAPAGLLDLIEMKFYKNNGTWISLAQ